MRIASTPKSSGAPRPKARTTKSKSRIDKAHKMIGELRELNSRSATATADIDFSATDRQTKQLIRLETSAYAIGDRKLFEGSISLLRRECAGPGGPQRQRKDNAAAPAAGDIKPAAGAIHKAESLRIVYFDQNARA